MIPSRRRPAQASAALSTLVSILLLYGCSDTSAPVPPRVAHPGQVHTGEVAPGEAHGYALYGRRGDRFAIELEHLGSSGTLHVHVFDLLDGEPVSETSVGPYPGGGTRRSRWFQMGRGEALLVRILGSGSPAGYRFTVLTPAEGPLTLGEVVSGAVFAGTDTFTFEGEAGQEVIVYARVPTGDESRTLTLTVSRGSESLRSVNFTGGELGVHSTGRIVLPVTGTYAIAVAGRGDYEVMVREIDRRPSAVGAAVPLDHWVEGERIDYVGDVDEFGIQTDERDDLVVVVRRETGLGQGFHVTLFNRDEEILRELLLHGSTDGEWMFRLPPMDAEGELTWVVEGRDSGTGAVGAYSFGFRQVDRRPSAAPAVVPVGMQVHEEIDHLGDIDEFELQVPHDGEYVLNFAGNFRLEGIGESAGLIPGAWGGRVTQPLHLPAGTLHLRVWAENQLRVGPYSFGLFAYDPLPQTVDARFAIGDSISGERIDFPGDVDVFTFAAVAGDELLLRARRNPGDSSDILMGAPGASMPFRLPGAPSIDDGWSHRFVAGHTGDHEIRFAGSQPMATGGYEFVLTRINRSPENVSAVVQAGVPVTGEALSPHGDIDRYTFQIPAGRRATLAGRTLTGTKNMRFEFPQLSSAVHFGRGTGELISGGFYVFDASSRQRTLTVNVDGDALVGPWGGSYAKGPYEFALFILDDAPEHASPALTLGDTVRGERIYPQGDRDLYSASLTAGEEVHLHLVAPSSDFLASVWDGQTHLFTMEGDPEGAVRSFVPQRTGTFTLIVQGVGSELTSVLGNYELALVAGPADHE